MPHPPRPTTHHQRILEDLKARIVGGDWLPGFQLPVETDLAERFGVSRMTMNKVLGQLTREGFLVRRRKGGTFVATPRAQAAVMAITDIEAEVRALGLPYRFALQSRTLRPATDAERATARIEDTAEVLALRGLHFAGDAPFCLEERIINPRVAPTASEQDFSTTAPGPWLLEQIPWTSAEHRIRALGAPPPTATALGLKPGTACLEVLRRTEIAGQWVTLARQTYPGDRHQLVAEFAPRSDEG